MNSSKNYKRKRSPQTSQVKTKRPRKTKNETEMALSKLKLKGTLKNNNVDEVDSNGDTALHKSARDNKIGDFNLLIKANANMNIQNNEGDTPLHIVCQRFNLQNMKKTITLLNAGASVNLRNKKTRTPLMNLVKSLDNYDFKGKKQKMPDVLKVADLLLKKGANINLTYEYRTSRNTVYPQTVLSTAINIYGGEDIVNFLLHNNVNVNDKISILYAVDKNDINLVRELVKRDADPNVRGNENDYRVKYSTPLLIAIKKKNWDILKILLQKGGAHPNDGLSLIASLYDDIPVSILKLLFQFGANPNLKISRNHHQNTTKCSHKKI